MNEKINKALIFIEERKKEIKRTFSFYQMSSYNVFGGVNIDCLEEELRNLEKIKKILNKKGE